MQNSIPRELVYDVDEMLEQAFSEAGKEPNFDFELDACGALPFRPPLAVCRTPSSSPARAQPFATPPQQTTQLWHIISRG